MENLLVLKGDVKHGPSGACSCGAGVCLAYTIGTGYTFAVGHSVQSVHRAVCEVCSVQWVQCAVHVVDSISLPTSSARAVPNRRATGACQPRNDEMEQGPTQPHAGRSTFLPPPPLYKLRQSPKFIRSLRLP